MLPQKKTYKVLIRLDMYMKVEGLVRGRRMKCIGRDTKTACLSRFSLL